MTMLSRRQVLKGTVSGAAASMLACWPAFAAEAATAPRGATFAVNVTPRKGSPLCGGLVNPVSGVSEPLQALGIVLWGSPKPVVLCAVDWCEIRNADHVFWRTELAKAAGTAADHVAVQSLHQHNAPLADTEAHRILGEGDSPLAVHDLEWHAQAVATVARAVRDALKTAKHRSKRPVGKS